MARGVRSGPRLRAAAVADPRARRARPIVDVRWSAGCIHIEASMVDSPYFAREPVGGVVRITVVAVSGSRPAEDGALAAALESARTDQWSPQMNA
ncbi:hypothetical protein GCM10011314_23670 [Knoellia flava]|uniref:Uncharacterized protein n=1 Tax=Knoellia flava TaxID=913969 RepID=A0A8H9FVC5_9MICO|nr:hypothetical protein GCM10011314_23670 [Knoellia flava]